LKNECKLNLTNDIPTVKIINTIPPNLNAQFKEDTSMIGTLKIGISSPQKKLATAVRINIRKITLPQPLKIPLFLLFFLFIF